MKQIVKDGQTLADIAVQEFGAWNAMIAIAYENDICISDVPKAGSELTMPNHSWNKTMENYCKSNDISPATAVNEFNIDLRIFGVEFSDEFK